MLKPVVGKAVANAAYEQLRRSILSRKFAPGERLPAERRLSEILHVNRNAVREALRRLQQARLISVRHGGGSTVQDFVRTGGLDLFTHLIVADDGSLNWPVVISMMEFRSAVAIDICTQATERMSAEDRRKLRAIFAEMASATTARDRFQQHVHLWAHIISCTRNITYRLAFNSLAQPQTTNCVEMHEFYTRELENMDQYVILVEAMCSGDAEMAGRWGRKLAILTLEHVRSEARAVGEHGEHMRSGAVI